MSFILLGTLAWRTSSDVTIKIPLGTLMTDYNNIWVQKAKKYQWLKIATAFIYIVKKFYVMRLTENDIHK